MSEIYWLTRLDSICGLFGIMTFISVIVIIIFSISYFVEELYDNKKGFYKILKISFFTFVFGVLGIIFVPTSKEALMIWGIGGTIDYIKSNDTIKQLPDKYIDALDKFIDEYNKDEKNN